MRHRGVPFLNVVFLAEVSEFSAIELSSVVSYNNLWNPKSTDDVSNDEIDHSFGCDCSQWLSLDPLSEVVYSYNSELRSALSYGETSDDVNSSHSERPWARHHF